MKIDAGWPDEYLASDEIVQAGDPAVQLLAGRLRSAHADEEGFARAAYEWVRDEVVHSLDAQHPIVTLTATEALRHRTGLCFAKSHLLVALVRAQGIPAGLCYQRLADGPGHVLHGLVAVYLRGAWHRQDPRGNRTGIDAQFSLTHERLAYRVDAERGELDYPQIHRAPATPVVTALQAADNALVLCAGGLPASLT